MNGLPEISEAPTLRQEGVAFEELSKEIVIVDHDDFEAAGRELQRNIAWQKRVNARLQPFIDNANKLHKGLTGLRNEIIAPAVRAEQLLRNGTSNYLREDEARRKQVEAELTAKARTDQNRAALSIVKTITEAREEIQTSSVAAAEEAVTAGDHETAEAILSHAATQPSAEQEAAVVLASATSVAPVILMPAPRAEGISGRRSFGYRIVDASKIDPKFLIPDEKAIKGVVKSMGLKAADMVGGIEVFEDVGVAVRPAKN